MVDVLVARSIQAEEAYLAEAVVARLIDVVKVLLAKTVEAGRIEVAEQYCCSTGGLREIFHGPPCGLDCDGLLLQS